MTQRIQDFRQGRRLGKLESAKDILEFRLQTIVTSGRPLSKSIVEAWSDYLAIAISAKATIEVEAINGRTGKFERVQMNPSQIHEALGNLENLQNPFICPPQAFAEGTWMGRRTPPQFVFVPDVLTPRDRQKLENVYELQDRLLYIQQTLNYNIETRYGSPATMMAAEDLTAFNNFASVILGTGNVTANKTTFAANLPRMHELAQNGGSKYWEEAVSAIVVTARNNFKDREPHESNVRELLRQVEYLDVRLKPENVFEDNAFPIFDPETPQKISQHDTPTADVDTVAELKAMMRDNDSAGKPIQETILNLRKLNDVPQPVSLRRSISTIDALLEIFGTNLSRVNGFDLKNLMDDDPSTYAVTKSKVLNLIHRSHRSYLKNKHREDEVLTLLDHISRITHDNEWLAQP